MFTVCPKCSLKLVVTAADLRVAQGYVRCGRCSNVFNALVGLSDEQQAVLAREERDAADADHAVATAGAEQPAARAGVPQGTARQQAPAAPGARVEESISDTRFEFDPVATDVSEVFVEPESDDGGSTGRSETITLRTEDAQPERASPEGTSAGRAPAERTSPENASCDSASQESPASADLDAHSLDAVQLELHSPDLEATDEFELADLEPLLDASAAPGPSATGSVAEPDPALSGGSDVVDVADVSKLADASHAPDAVVATQRPPAPRSLPSSPDGVLDPLSIAAPAPRGMRLVLQLGTAALALLLVGQIAHHYRATLAEIDWVRPPLTAIYAALGMPLVPHWDVSAYEVRQLGAVAGPENPGALTVRASIKNTAPMRQPLPLLRVTVQDRFGNRVGARDVPPRAYLPKASAERLYLAAGQRVDAEIAFADPGASIVGFEIDACLEDAAGRISCANDASGAR
jgi:predicted Zn finger-like uncharacterized protein